MYEARRIVRASPEHVFSHIARAEHLPRYGGPLWMTADPGERRGVEHVVTARGYFAGLPVEAVVRAVVRPPRSVELAQLYGTLRTWRAVFTVRAVEDGSEISYRVEADPGIPLLSEEASRQFLVQHVERLLDRVKQAAERKTPGPRRARPEPGPGAPPEDALPAGPPAEEEGHPAEETGILEPTAPASPGAVAEAGGRPGSAGARVGRRRRRRRRRSQAKPGSPPPGAQGNPP